MNYTQTDIDRLVAAALDWAERNKHAKCSSKGELALNDALEPFRPKKPRVGQMSYHCGWGGGLGDFCKCKAIELTDEVKVRLSETAGVDAREVLRIVSEPLMSIEKKPSAIMNLIAKGKVDYE